MAIESGFFDSNSAENVNGFLKGDKAKDAAFFARYFSSIIGDGIFPNPSDNFQFSPSGQMNLTRQGGSCWIRGYFAFDDSPKTFVLPSSGNYQTFYHVLRLDTGEGEISELLLHDPVVPPPLREGNIWDLLLAVVRIPAGATAVTASMIEDTRHNSSVCGIVCGTVEQIGTDTLYNQLHGVIDDAGRLREALDEYISQTKNDFDDWFDEMKAQLSKDAAGNLQLSKADVSLNNVNASSVTPALLSPGAVTEAKLGNKAVTNTKIADNAVTYEKLSDEIKSLLKKKYDCGIKFI